MWRTSFRITLLACVLAVPIYTNAVLFTAFSIPLLETYGGIGYKHNPLFGFYKHHVVKIVAISEKTRTGYRKSVKILCGEKASYKLGLLVSVNTYGFSGRRPLQPPSCGYCLSYNDSDDQE